MLIVIRQLPGEREREGIGGVIKPEPVRLHCLSALFHVLTKACSLPLNTNQDQKYLKVMEELSTAHLYDTHNSGLSAFINELMI